ncbi:MAG: hypothetical protein H6Q36_867 [Chloroflexi bacterium]|nr:hypothetical protein [Chloroflexota bacterium]
MTPELLVVAAVRIAGSLPVLRWPFAGALLAIAVDFSDLFLRDYLDLGGLGDYQAVDKWLDQVMLALFLVVSLRWRGPVRLVAVLLYLFRLEGFLLFELTGERIVLVMFPNVFETWFVVAAFLAWRSSAFAYTGPRVAALLLACTAFKLGQELLLHAWRVFDAYSTVDVVNAITRWLGG